MNPTAAHEAVLTERLPTCEHSSLIPTDHPMTPLSRGTLAGSEHSGAHRLSKRTHYFVMSFFFFPLHVRLRTCVPTSLLQSTAGKLLRVRVRRVPGGREERQPCAGWPWGDRHHSHLIGTTLRPETRSTRVRQAASS